MQTEPDPIPPSPESPRRPWWYWVLLGLPAAITSLGVFVDEVAYRAGGGGDRLHGLASGLSIGLGALIVGLIGSVFLAGWEGRHHRGGASGTMIAIGVFLCLQFWNMGVIFAGCTVGQQAAVVLVR